MTRRIIVGALIAVALAVAPLARAEEPGPVSDCKTTNGGDRGTSILTPGSTANQVSLWVTGDAGPDQAGLHVEPWARRAYFVDAGAGTDGSAGATARVDGDDGEGVGYAAARAGTTG